MLRGLIRLNFAVVIAIHRYYPYFAILGGPFSLGGLWMLVTGQPKGNDDGTGGADESGTGLRGLADRVEALGGSLELTSPPGGGTCVRATIPT